MRLSYKNDFTKRTNHVYPDFGGYRMLCVIDFSETISN